MIIPESLTVNSFPGFHFEMCLTVRHISLLSQLFFQLMILRRRRHLVLQEDANNQFRWTEPSGDIASVVRLRMVAFKMTIDFYQELDHVNTKAKPIHSRNNGWASHDPQQYQSLHKE